MSSFVNAILSIIYVFPWNQVNDFLININPNIVLNGTIYLLFNLGFWVVLGIFFNFIYRLTKFIYNLIF